MASIRDIIDAAEALKTAEELLNSLRDRRQAIQLELDTLAPKIQSARSQVSSARDDLVTLVSQGVEI